MNTSPVRLLLIGILAACGESSPSSAPTDTLPASDVTPEVWVDTAPTSTCSRDGFTVDAMSANAVLPGHFALALEAGGGAERLSIGIRHGGVYKGLAGAGTVDLSGSTYESCDNCVVARHGCTADGQCDKVFFVDAGTMAIERWDEERFVATLSNVVLVEVNIDNPIAIMPKLNGDTWCFNELAMDAPLSAGQGPIITQPTCVADGSGSFLGHNIANFSLPNCLGEMVSLHDTCGERKAHWIMGTTGWCSPCSAKIQAMAGDHGGQLSRAAIHEKTPGLDLWIVLSQDSVKAPPTAEYCLQYAQDHNVDPAMVLYDYVPDGETLILAQPAGETATVKSMGVTWSNINPYTEFVTGRGLHSKYPWYALLDGDNMAYHWSEYLELSTLETMKEQLLAD